MLAIFIRTGATCLDRLPSAKQDLTSLFAALNAEGRGFSKHQLGEAVGVFRFCQHRQQRAGADFQHLHRDAEYIEHALSQ